MQVRDLVPLTLTRTYRPGDTTSREFGYGTMHSYSLYLYLPDRGQSIYDHVQVVKPDGGVLDYVNATPGAGWESAIFQNATAGAPYHNTTIRFYDGSWILSFHDGTRWQFANYVSSGTYGGSPLLRAYDRFGVAIEVTHIGGVIARVTSPSGRFLEFDYDASNRIVSVEDNSGRLAGYEYNPDGYLWKATDLEGHTEEYLYHPTTHDMVSVKDRRGNTMVTNEYYTAGGGTPAHAVGRVKTQTLADGGVFQFEYPTTTRTKVTNPRGYVRQIDFNAQGFVTQRIDAFGETIAQTTVFEREADTNLLLATTDALNRRTEYTYDDKGNLTSITRLAGTPEAVTETLTYTADYNQLASYQDPLGHTTQYRYDYLGRLLEIEDPLGHITYFEHSSMGQLTRVTDPLGHPTDFGYEVYDLRSVTDPLSRTTTTHTDTVGRIALIIDPLGHQTRYEYDQLSQLKKVIDATGKATELTYDQNGNLQSVKDARGGVHTFGYDAKNRRNAYKDPLPGSAVEILLYDKTDNLEQRIDRKGQVSHFDYDALNRRSFAGFGATQQDPTAFTATIDYTHDAGNRLTDAVDSVSGTVHREYDGLDRLRRETTPQGRIDYTYDPASRRKLMTVEGQPAIVYAFDDANRLESITRGAVAVGYTYDAANRRDTLTLPNGIVVDYGFDEANQLQSLRYALGATPLGDLTYAYDEAGRRIRVGGSLARSGLPAALAQEATYDAANRLSTWGGASLIHDANGNLESDGSRTYAWDARDRLTSISAPFGGTFAYDAYDRRTHKSVAGTEVRFLYDGGNVVQTQNSAGSPTSQVLAGLNLDEWLARISVLGTASYLPDALGSTLALANAAGATTAAFTYEPYGKTSKTGADDTSFRYTGREDDGTGLYYYRARYYHPGLGRFVAEDPIGLAGGVNLYGYVGGNPVSNTDPLGLQQFPIPTTGTSDVQQAGAQAMACALNPAACKPPSPGACACATTPPDPSALNGAAADAMTYSMATGAAAGTIGGIVLGGAEASHIAITGAMIGTGGGVIVGGVIIGGIYLFWPSTCDCSCPAR